MAGRIRKIINIHDLQIPNDYIPWKHGITQSLLNSFMLCRVAYLLNINRLKTKRDGYNQSFGNLFHYLLDRLYNRWETKKDLPTTKIINVWLEDFTEEYADDLGGLPEDQLEKRLVCAEVMLKWYIDFYHDDFENNNKFLYMERSLKVEFYDFPLMMKCDGVITCKDGTNWLFEHKTLVRIIEDIIQDFLAFDFQSLFYITCLEIFSKLIFSGVIYNVVRNPGHGRKITNLKAYRKILNTEIKKKPKHFFKRYQQAYSVRNKKQFINNLQSQLFDLRLFHTGKIGCYRNQNSCQRLYKCDHLPACSSGKLINYRKIESMFNELEDKYVKRF